MNDQAKLVDGNDQWDRVASELRACRESQQRAYGGIDSSDLGRYLAGEASEAERATLESAMGDLPELKLLTDLVKDVLGGLEPVCLDPIPLPVAVPEPGPAVLPFRRPALRRAAIFRNRASIAAAACLLLAIGFGLPATGLFTSKGGNAASLASLAIPFDNGEASKGFGGLDKMADPPGIVRVALAAPESNMREQVAGRRGAFRKVSSLTHAGKMARQHGKYVEAVSCYRQAKQVCRHNHIDDYHPATVNVIRGEARLIQLALNAQPSRMESRLAVSLAPPGPDRTRREASDVLALRSQIKGKTIADIRIHIVPVLTTALRSASRVEDRLAYIAALGKVGPAAGPAVPALAQRLVRSDDPSERLAVLKTLEEMGPPAQRQLSMLLAKRQPHPAAPRGTGWGGSTPPAAPRGTGWGPPPPPAAPRGMAWGGPWKAGKPGFGRFPYFRPLNDAEKARLREATATLPAEQGRTGVQDTIGHCTIRVVRDTNKTLLELARSRKVEVLVETVSPVGHPNPGGRPNPAHRLASMGEHAVYIVICPAKKSATLHVSPALRREKFPAAAMSRELGAVLAASGCDQAVAAVPGRITSALAR